MKRWVFILLTFFFSLPSAYPLQGRVERCFPNQVEVSWDRVENAVFYDLYLNREAVKRLKSSVTNTFLGSNEQPLASNTSYSVIISARDEENRTLESVEFPVLTTSWEGTYRWINLTENDNKGKCRELVLLVVDEGPVFEVYGLFPEVSKIPLLLFPLVSPDQEQNQFSYEGAGIIERTYRTNAEVFNTTSIKPKTWQVLEIEKKNAFLGIKMLTKIGALSFKTESWYEFIITEEGEKRVLFHNTGTGMASWGIFKSPNPGEHGVFVFHEK